MFKIRTSRPRAFTLVELLVVIGIIALLIGILLPTLSRARQAAKTLACLSNMRQIGTSVVNYSIDNESIIVPAGYVGTSTFNNRNNNIENWASILVNDGYLDAPLYDDVTALPSDNSVFRCPEGLDNMVTGGGTRGVPHPESPDDGLGAAAFRIWSNNLEKWVDVWYGNNGTSAWNAPGMSHGVVNAFGLDFLPTRRYPNDLDKSDYRMTRITSARNSSKLVFLYDGIFMNQWGGPPTRANAWRINGRHNEGTKTNLVFFDGHAETAERDQVPTGLDENGETDPNEWLVERLGIEFPAFHWRLDQE